MTVLLRHVQIIDPQSSHHNQIRDILIEKGRITAIGTNLDGNKAVDLEGHWVTPGWMDMHMHVMDPGAEYKEDFNSAKQVAQSGGYTSCLVYPNTDPVLATKSDVSYVMKHSDSALNWQVAAAVTVDTSGEHLNELYDLHKAGAVAYTDGIHPLTNKELILKALQYTDQFNGLLINRPATASMRDRAQMHEGLVSTQLGLRGEPSLSEQLEIQAQLELLSYAGGRLHFTQVSSGAGLDLIRKAKKSGLAVSCDVSVAHLCYTDAAVSSFDTRFKVDPPLRSETDREALIKGVNDGTVDAIVSAHLPQDVDAKALEFDLAAPGMNSLQVVFPMLRSLGDQLNWDRAIQAVTNSPRALLSQEEAQIEEGEAANLSVWNPTEEWVWDEKTNKSKSTNHPAYGQTLTGRCRGTINGSFIGI